MAEFRCFGGSLTYQNFSSKREGKCRLEDMSVDGIIKKNYNEIYGEGVDWIVWHRVGTSAGFCAHKEFCVLHVQSQLQLLEVTDMKTLREEL